MPAGKRPGFKTFGPITNWRPTRADVVEFPGEEFSPFVDTFIAAILVLTPVSEEFGFTSAAALEDVGTPIAALAEPPSASPPPPSEEFGGAHPTEEVPTPPVAVLDAPLILTSVQEEFLAPAASLSIEETGFSPALVPDVRPTTFSAPEDFEGSLPLEEPATPQTFLEPVWISWSVREEEFGGAHPTEEFGAFVLTRTDLPIQLPSATEDVFTGSLSLEEVSSPQTFVELVWITWSFSEEFGGAHPTEESAAFSFLTAELPQIYQSTTADEFPGSLPLEESPSQQTISQPIWFSWSVSEELFAGSLPLEEPSNTQPFVEATWFSWSVSEEFGGAHPTEEFGSFTFTPIDLIQPQSFQSSAEDVFAGSLPLEEPSSAQQFVELTWITWSVSEEFAGSLPLIEEPSPAQALLEPVQPVQIWSFPESFEGFSGALPLEESFVLSTPPEPIWIGISFSEEFGGSFFVEEHSPQASTVSVVPVGLFSASEEFFGPFVPPPPPPPPPPTPGPIVLRRSRATGTGFGPPEVIDTEGEEVVDVITLEDVRCVVDALCREAQREDIQKWTRERLKETKGQTRRASVLLREVQEVPSLDPICGSAPLARVSLYGAAAISDGLEVRVAIHSYSGKKIDRVLLAVLADDVWRYADPNSHLPLGHVMPFAKAQFYEPARERKVELATELDRQIIALADEILATTTPSEPRSTPKSRRIPGIWLVLAGVLVGILIAKETDRR